jgi:hypothetical protein
MKITFETDERSGAWNCIMWDKEGNMLTYTTGKSALEAEALMKNKLMALFPH